ncbi:MAG TPA: S8 family serine peptidase [Pseudoxanthomonas sp.]|nr:S8 family serine peptidase [Pseudoxanthomonas sp.]
MNERRRWHPGLGKCALSVAVALLAACGGGGGGGTVRSTPPPTGGLGFTPTVANDTTLTQVSPPTVPTQAAPITFSSPSLNQHLILTNAAGALGAGLKGQGVAIGFLDTGVNRNHPALSGRVTQNFIHVGSSNDLSVDDKVGHGTVVASLAAGRPAVGNYLNSDGTNSGQTGSWGGGVAQNATVLSSRIISDAPPPDDGSGEGNPIGAGQGYGDYFKELNAQLAGAGARIINNSWGGLYWDDPALTDELATAWKDFAVSRGGIVVFANGNAGRDATLRLEPSDNARLPTLASDAALEKGWLTVAALDTANPTQLTDYSQQCGSAMNYCLTAPGDVVFIDPDATSQATSGLYQGGGTSFAAPLVSGTAAVVWSAFPYFSNDQVRQAILGGAKDLGAAGVDPVFGWGLLDVSKAANGPSNFAWGDFSVSFSGNSVWRNPIVGNGGLIKGGAGTLTLTEAATYTGATRVDAGGLDIRKGLKSDLSVAAGATVWASGAFAGNVANNGRFLNGAGTPASIAGNFTQSATGNFGVWLGSKLTVGGTASLSGQASILGVKSGYTTTAKETLLTATGGVIGTFSSLKAAPNVFLDATLAYDPNNVFLNINRIDVSTAVAGMGLSDVTQVSAIRVEGAMQAIDGQLASGADRIGSGFIDVAGALQHVASVAMADRAIRSLSGELHAAADAAGLDNLEASRRALSARFGELAGQSTPRGNWYRPLGQPGQGGSALGQFQNDGWLMGSDQQLGAKTVAGFAFGETDTDGLLGYDRSRERQTQARFYVGTVRGRAYTLGQFGAGRYERQLRRTLLLGDRADRVATDYAGNFTTANLEAGYRFGGADKSWVPYAGVDYARLDRDGFIENGAAGFGLKTHDSIAERTLAVAGLRAERAWTTGSGMGWTLRGYAEWQRTLSENGLLAQASFVGADSWPPLYGEGFSRSSGLLGLGIDATLSRHAMLSLGYNQRFGSFFDDRQWSAKLRYGL